MTGHNLSEKNLIDLVKAVNKGNDLAMSKIGEIENSIGARNRDKKVGSWQDTVKSQSTEPKYEVLGENHAHHKENLEEAIKSASTNSVIFIERKKDGHNMGWKDIKALSKIIKHNETEENKINIPKNIPENAIEDAKAMLVAKEKGIKIAFMEGSSLQKGPDKLNNKNREAAMIDNIRATLDKLEQKGVKCDNVKVLVGQNHVKAIEEGLSQKRASMSK